MSETFFTSESVTEGHPDKMADQISDAVLDACLEQDPMSRVACETMITTGLVIVAGEITTKANIDVQKIVRHTISCIGYKHAADGIDPASCAVLVTLDKQSPGIAKGVDTGGAGDQGMMFGYATDETPELLPAPLVYAHKFARRLAQVRKEGIIQGLRPDGKSQVTMGYNNGEPAWIETVVISAQHEPEWYNKQDELKQEIIEHVLVPCGFGAEDRVLFNPTGSFLVGGPYGDCGLTGRKIIVDTYGGVGRHGGGAFSGKDPTKVDRSAAYMARHIAKCIVADGRAKKCEVQLAYAIGVAEPVSVYVNTYGTGYGNIDYEALVRDNFPLTPTGIIEYLDLRRPIYQKSCTYGHFCRNNVPWEKTKPLHCKLS